MNDDKKSSIANPLAEQIGTRAMRKLKARKERPTGAWSGLGMMGMIGWSVSVPSLVGVALGAWLDSNYPGVHAWTLALLVAGMTLGCFSAWRWVAQEQRAMHAPARDDDNA